MKYICIILLLMYSFAINCYAIDNSIYCGKWKTIEGKVDIELIIENKKTILLNINNKKINNIKFDFPYANSAMFPFMFISSELNNVKYSLYLTIGTDGYEINNLNIIRGFYIESQIGNDQYGEIKSKHYPVELRKYNNK